jgi:hypothetical protein
MGTPPRDQAQHLGIIRLQQIGPPSVFTSAQPENFFVGLLAEKGYDWPL